MIGRGAPVRAVSCQESFKLSANMQDPDNSEEEESYLWECTDRVTQMPCLYNDGNEITGLPLPDKSEIKIDGSWLECNNDYLFTLNYRKGASRSLRRRVVVKNVEAQPPEGVCREPKYYKKRISLVEMKRNAVVRCWVRSFSPVY